MNTQVPEDLSTLDDDELQALYDALVAEFDESIEDSTVATDEVAKMAEAIQTLEAEKTTREDKAVEDANRRSELRAKVHGDPADADHTDDDGDDPDADPAADAGDADAGDATDADPDPDADAGDATDADTDANEREPVAAGATPASAKGTSGRAGRPTPPPAPTPNVITAASDVPGYSSGQKITPIDVAKGFHARARGLANGSPRLLVASVNHVGGGNTVIGDDTSADEQLAIIEKVVAEKLANTDAKALVASGGWCTPSTPLFDQFAVESADGLLDLPSVTVTRGGIQVPSFFGLTDAQGALWDFTEDQDAAGAQASTDIDVASNVATVDITGHGYEVGDVVRLSGTGVANLDGDYTVATVADADTFTFATAGVGDTTDQAGSFQKIKQALGVPCPTWTDHRLGAEGLTVTHGNLMDRAYPEMTRRFVNLVMTAHLHRMSNAKLATIIGSAEAVDMSTGVSDAAGDIFNALDLQVADFRSEHLMDENVVLEAAVPQWWIEAIRSTLAMRSGVEAWNVARSAITAAFTSRNVRPQYLSGYDALYRGGDEAVTWPTTSKFSVWPAGSYVEGRGGSIDLGVVRDSRLNETNDFTAAWSEEFFTVVQRGPAAREITVDIDVNGVTGGLQVAGS